MEARVSGIEFNLSGVYLLGQPSQTPSPPMCVLLAGFFVSEALMNERQIGRIAVGPEFQCNLGFMRTGVRLFLFDGDMAIEVRLAAFVHDTHAAVAEQFGDLKVRKPRV
jgi:hypothetical protein